MPVTGMSKENVLFCKEAFVHLSSTGLYGLKSMKVRDKAEATYLGCEIPLSGLSTSSGKDLSDIEMHLEERVEDSKGDETKYFGADSSVQQRRSRLYTGRAL